MVGLGSEQRVRLHVLPINAYYTAYKSLYRYSIFELTVSQCSAFSEDLDRFTLVRGMWPVGTPLNRRFGPRCNLSDLYLDHVGFSKHGGQMSSRRSNRMIIYFVAWWHGQREMLSW